MALTSSAETMDRILKSGDAEVFLHSNTAGFPVRKFDWVIWGLDIKEDI